ncbi:class A beta-lactamase-related serine hydrolase [Alginatibacterium sediminis]|uniref:Class A beta-lactamase-related serine hydrolase n=1 Tax=Alginatibacterium sediminis TaxID=2164068 RepID=A0A420EDD8_9ALTE|nr:serine hydrolase domain-containing protein [Alginatibacterium sediminis]RKF18681.1 class A beta-lactamase-related serine hydrolase [Alginatibacterium sediminis]
MNKMKYLALLVMGPTLAFGGQESHVKNENMTKTDVHEEIYISKITDVTTPISKAKESFPLNFTQDVSKKFSTPNWQSAGDHGVFVNLNIPKFINVDIAMPTHDIRNLKRAINPDLKEITFTQEDGSETPKLEEYLGNDYNRVQAIIMAHKGKVVFEAYPGMNPSDFHVWMSASKTTVGTLCVLLESEGKMDLDKSIPFYAPELKGTAWDKVSVKNALNMASGLDLEETTAAFSDPNSWIEKFFASLFSQKEGGQWLDVLKNVQAIDGEEPGERFRYSTAITQALTMAIEGATGQTYKDVFNEKVWSKLGVQNQFMVGLTSDGTAVGGGLVNTTIEDALKYAMMFTPSWNVVSEQRVITPKVLERIRTLGDPAAYVGSEEEAYSLEWTGEKAERNSAQWDHIWADGGMFKHGNMHQGIYTDPERDFAAFVFSTSPNERSDKMPGYMRAVAKKVAGK